MPISKKYSFSVIFASLLFIAIPFTFFFDEVKALPPLYKVTLCLSLMLGILVIAVSYLTGQAKIDLEATIGKEDKA
jgi:hypothetical protein